LSHSNKFVLLFFLPSFSRLARELPFKPIVSLLRVLNTLVSGVITKQLVSEFGLVGPDEHGYLENPSKGIALGSEQGLIDSVFLHATGKDDYDQFSGPLPAGLTFESRQQDVRRTTAGSSSTTASHARA
jgi:hypothetical protein